MFTGIVTGCARVASIGKNPSPNTDPNRPSWGDVRLVLDQVVGVQDAKKFAIGASMSCSGVCLTLVEQPMGDDGKAGLAFDVSEETLAKTTLKSWQVGQMINLEPSLHFGDELGGHMVAGHVDTTVKAVGQKHVAGSTEWWFSLPPDGAAFLAPKGSVALDGVSLTVNLVEKDRFSVMIIPHTESVTSFGRLKLGDDLNIEYDTMARYIARQLALPQGK